MKNIRLDLELFSENGEGCAAEQSVTEGTVHGEETVQEADTISEENFSEKIATGDADATERIGAFFGINDRDADSLISSLRKRQARAELLDLLKARKAEKVYSELKSEADRLSSKIKGFDLKKELSDCRYANLVRSGFSLEEAWRAVHTEELISTATENAKTEAVAVALEKLADAAMRPAENGLDMKSSSNSKSSVENLTGRGIRDILKRVENGAKIKF